MYYFTSETIAQANKRIASLDAKVGGLLCILSCLGEDIKDNFSYTINGTLLRRQLSTVFDKIPKESFDNVKSNYIIFAKDWPTTFFRRYIKNKVDLIACAIFFLRRNGFEKECTEEEIIDLFVKRFHLQSLIDQWFYKGKTINIAYNQDDVEDNQIGFYSKMQYTAGFKSILFSGVIQKSAADLKAAGQIQTLYSGSGVQTCFLLSDEPLDQYYIMNNSNNAEADKTNNSLSTGVAENVLLYGVPGCGKSNTIKTQYCNDDDYMERAVFHPDYTYSDFVGQILPKVSDTGKVTYEFEPGPFTRILKDSIDNIEDTFYLVIEEINRGNAPAIFGDIFQLLDRDDSGESEYGISNEAIAGYVYGDKKKKIKIPRNLFILATMNTSDQNVFTLDTAFKRRWSMKHIENNIDACRFADHPVCGSDISWRVFAKTINNLIIEVSTENLSNEDNRLGAYFVRENELDDMDRFGEKVLMYLWNDAFKYDHEKVFRQEYRTLDELIKGFKNEGMNVFNNDVDFSVETPYGEILVESTGSEAPIENYLVGKNSRLIAYYNALRDLVKSRVPNTRESSTKSLQYAAWRADNISKSSFADLYFQSNRILIRTEIPTTEDYLSFGKEIPKDGHKNHYFELVYDDNSVDQIVEIIVESYEQLVKE